MAGINPEVETARLLRDFAEDELFLSASEVGGAISVEGPTTVGSPCSPPGVCDMVEFTVLLRLRALELLGLEGSISRGF